VLMVCHYRCRKAKQTKNKKFAMTLFPFSNYLTIIFFLMVTVLLAFERSTLISLIFAAVWFAGLSLIYTLAIKKAQVEN
ncbi:MAG: amino acid permease, partial [Liquorilactobacillus ghanensis]